MRVGIAGGGPAGLTFAWLARRLDPTIDVRIVERDRADATYGWGVVFSDTALSFVRDVAPELHAAITAGQIRHESMRIVHRGTEVMLPNNAFLRMARIDLLRVLRRECERLGVAIEYGRRVEALDEFGDCDLVVVADGANSAIRTRLAAHFDPTLDVRPNWLAWYGTTQAFDPLSLVFRPCADGLLIAHAYRYSPTHSTFLVECDPSTYAAAGFDRMDADASLRYCERVFAEDLAGHPLLSNRSDWFRYTIVSNRRWSWGRVVLLGDALRTGHPSVGSGTRLAMQDAIALHQAVAESPGDMPRALAAFERRRRPGSDTLQAAAVRSTRWYETVRERLDLDPVSFAVDYLTRTGHVTHADIRARDPALAAAFDALHPPAGEPRP